MVWGCISAYVMGSLHVLEGTMNAERYIKALEQHILPSRQRLFQGRPGVFQQDNAKPHTAAITTAWLRSRRVWVLNWPACSPDLSPIENIWCIICHTSKTTTNSSAAGNLYQAIMRPNSNTKTTETHNLYAQTSSNCFEKKWRCYTMVNMPPSQLFWDLLQASNLKWDHFVHTIVTFLSLNICYVIYVLLWTKYWLMWFESLLVFILFKFKKCPNISGNRVRQTHTHTHIYIYIYIHIIYIYIYIYTLYCMYVYIYIYKWKWSVKMELYCKVLPKYLISADNKPIWDQ